MKLKHQKRWLSLDVIVVSTTVTKTPQELGLDVPSNARIEKYIPFANLVPYMSVCVTNGGFGGISLALAIRCVRLSSTVPLSLIAALRP